MHDPSVPDRESLLATEKCAAANKGYGRFLILISIVNCRSRAGVAGLLSNKEDKQMPSTKSGGSKRGFAAMDPAKQREIASKGGKASHGGGRRSSSASR